MSWPAPSDRFALAVEASHVVAIKVEVLADGHPEIEIPGLVLDGTVTQERAVVRTSATLDIADPNGNLSAVDADPIIDLLTPLAGHELRIWRGIAYPDVDDPELVPLGVLVITSVVGAWPHLQVECRDRMWLVTDKRGRLRTATQIAASTNYADAITTLLVGTGTSGLPSRVPVDIPDTPQVTPLLSYEQQASRGEEASKLAKALGRILYADREGTITTIPEPDPAAEQVSLRLVEWEAEDAELGGAVLLDANRRQDAEQVTNVYVVDSEATGGSVWHGEAADLDPNSPTFVDTFGESVEFLSSPLMTSQDMINKAARTGLANRVGLGEPLELEVAANPLPDVADVAYVRRRAGLIDGNHMLDRIQLGLRSARMQLTTRNVLTDLDAT